MSHNLISKQVLTAAELHAIQELATICENYEQLHMRLSWEMLRSRPGTTAHDFLYYVDNLLVGYLALDTWGLEEKELVAMVHPDYRRQHIFRKLLTAASQETSPLGTERLILTCESSSASGQACMKALEAIYGFSEHEMVLAEFRDSRRFDERLCFRQAAQRDTDMLVSILVGSFNGPEDVVRHRVMKLFQDPTRRFYLATLGGTDVGCEEPVGCLRLDAWDNVVGIYGFGVLPAYQGRGYGRQILEETIRTIRATSQRTITLDVDRTNSRALALYRSCGFQVKTSYDYYGLAIRPT